MKPIRPLLAATALTALTISPALAESRSYDFTGFDSIRSTSGVDVIVKVGSGYSIELETNGDPEAALVEMNGDTLVLGRQKTRGMSFGRGARYEFRVTMPDFEAGRATSGSDLFISGISGGDIELSSSSGSDLEAEGTCGSLDADASSGSDIRAFDLSCSDVTAEASSGADVEVTATQSIRARASSGADVRVQGNPESRETSKSSGGSVSIR